MPKSSFWNNATLLLLAGDVSDSVSDGSAATGERLSCHEQAEWRCCVRGSGRIAGCGGGGRRRRGRGRRGTALRECQTVPENPEAPRGFTRHCSFRALEKLWPLLFFPVLLHCSLWFTRVALSPLARADPSSAGVVWTHSARAPQVSARVAAPARDESRARRRRALREPLEEAPRLQLGLFVHILSVRVRLCFLCWRRVSVRCGRRWRGSRRRSRRREDTRSLATSSSHSCREDRVLVAGISSGSSGLAVGPISVHVEDLTLRYV